MSIPGAANPLLLATAAAGGYQISRSLRFSSIDSAFLSRTPASAGNRKTWSLSFWIKFNVNSGNQYIFAASPDGYTSDFHFAYLRSDGTIKWDDVVGGSNVQLNKISNQVFRDFSAWYHFLFVVDTTNGTAANRNRLYVNGSEITWASGNNFTSNADSSISRACVHHIGGLNQSSSYLSAYLADVHFIDGQALTPSSFTEVSATTGQLIPKQYTGSFGTNGFWLKFSDNSAATATTLGKDYSPNGNNWTPNNLSVTGLVDHTPAGLSYRDSSTASRTWDQSSASSSTSAAIGPDRIYWVDLGASKSFNRITFSVVASGQSSDTSTNFITYFSTSSSSTGSSICGGGCTVTSASRPSATTPGTITVTFAGFASQTGRYIGITNGSGAQGGTYTYSNFKVYDDQGAANDSLVDTPSSAGTDTGLGGQVTGNYCTWNPLKLNTNGSLANGNLDWSSSTGGGLTVGTIGVSSGKWYWEVSVTSGSNCGIGVFDPSAALTTYSSDSAKGIGYYGSSGSIFYNGGSASYGSTFTTGDVIGVALDLDNGKIYFAKNGTWQNSGNPATQTNPARTGLSGTYAPEIDAGASSAHSASLNAGARPFAYTAPSGFKALCDTNLPAPVVAKPNTVMDIALYTGNGAARSITGFNFGPDLVWIKRRDSANSHRLFDAVRGAGAHLTSNGTDAESTTLLSLSAFNSNGFSLGDNTDGQTNVNISGGSYVAWCFDAGSSTVSNTQGSITSQVRANASAGFSIITAVQPVTANLGCTVGHGLGVAPAMYIVKDRDLSINWGVYHAGLSSPATQALQLSTTSAAFTATNYWKSTSPTSTVLSIGTSIVGEGNDFVVYAFAPVAGYSSFGSYTGGGSSYPFVYCGFRPRLILIKDTTTGGTFYDWFMLDTARNPYNFGALNSDSQYTLFANTSGQEQQWLSLDILSNGFRVIDQSATINNSGSTYVWAAWAESPFAYSRAR